VYYRSVIDASRYYRRLQVGYSPVVLCCFSEEANSNGIYEDPDAVNGRTTAGQNK